MLHHIYYIIQRATEFTLVESRCVFLQTPQGIDAGHATQYWVQLLGGLLAIQVVIVTLQHGILGKERTEQ